MESRFVAIPATGSAARPAPAQRDGQRAACRMPYRVPCQVRLVHGETGEVHTLVGQTVNLSRDGLAVQVATNAPCGTWIETLVPHGDGEPLFLCGRVVHSRRTLSANYELGIQITATPPT